MKSVNRFAGAAVILTSLCLLGTRSLAQHRSSNSDDMAGILMIPMPALDNPTLELKDKDQQIEKLVSRLET